jgi:extracellular elastinolytic metalloproteinase
MPSAMGGDDTTVTIPGVMVSKSDGATLKTLAGQATTMRLRSPSPFMKDASLDSDVVWHEYGHGLTWRMIGNMKGPLAGAIGEGMSDVLSVIVNDDPVVGEYSSTDPAGIRSASYENYPNTYGDIVGTEVHADGEVYGAIGWDLWKQYKAAGLGRSAVLADLVNGMNFTPSTPTYEQMRDGILNGLVASGQGARQCMVWNSFAKYGVGVGAVGKVVGQQARVTESFAKPASCN